MIFTHKTPNSKPNSEGFKANSEAMKRCFYKGNYKKLAISEENNNKMEV